MLSDKEVRVLLSKLCVSFGVCLPADAQEQLASAPPADARGFVDAVFVAEGLDPSTAARHLYREVRAIVSDAYANAAVAGEHDA